MGWQIIEDGSITSVPGILAAGVHCGLKEEGKLDLALVSSQAPATAAGVFTRNLVKAAPVVLCQRTLAGNGKAIRGVVINSGNANACTGPQGMKDAQAIAAGAAEALGVTPDSVLVMSTGVIGRPMSMDKIEEGILRAARELSLTGGHLAAQGIMTTDTVPKEIAIRVKLRGGEITIGGMVKGAGMIHPNLATMLALIITDAKVEGDLLQEALREAVEQSFNAITVDGDTSTNDTVLLLANGLSGVTLGEGSEDFLAFHEGLSHTCGVLAKMIVRDAEGATKFVEVRVKGARSSGEAKQVAYCIAGSSSVKTMLFGQDPNWGRIMVAIGSSGAEIEPEKIGVRLGRVPVVVGGRGSGVSREEAQRPLLGREIAIEVDLGLGDACATVWTSDLSYDYVRLNAEYTT